MSLFTKKSEPTIDPEQRELIENAQARIKQKKRLYRHFVFFLAGAVVLIVVNLVLGVGAEFEPFQTPWFVWAILIWTFFFLAHLINVFLLGSFMNKQWEEKQIERLTRLQKERIAALQERVAKEHPLPEKKSSLLTDPDKPLSDQNTLP